MMVEMTVVKEPETVLEVLSETVMVPDVSGNYDEGIEAGKKAEYDCFWDEYQADGKRTNYNHSFCTMWSQETFKPKYDMVPTSASGMFLSSAIGGSLKEILAKAGVTLDFGKAQTINQCFSGAAFTEIGIIDFRSATSSTAAFYNMPVLKRIEKLIVSSAMTYSSTFASVPALEDITIEGVIGQNGFNVSASAKLSHNSLMSIINALQSGVTSRTVTLGAANLAKLTNTEKVLATQKGWTLA